VPEEISILCRPLSLHFKNFLRNFLTLISPLVRILVVRLLGEISTRRYYS